MECKKLGRDKIQAAILTNIKEGTKQKKVVIYLSIQHYPSHDTVEKNSDNLK